MEAKSMSMYIVPSRVSEIPGEFMFYVTVVDYDGIKPVEARTIMQRHVNFPSAGDREELDWAIEVCDYMYQEITSWNALVKREKNAETNARPGDSSVSS